MTEGSGSFGRGTVSRDAAWSLVYASVVRVATLVLSVAVARRLGSAGMGAFGIALQVTALGSLIACFNLPQGLAKTMPESGTAARTRLLTTATLLVFSVAGALCVVLLAAAPWLARHVYGDASLASVLAWCGPLIAATAGTLLAEGALQGLRRFGSLARWGGIVSVLDTVFGTLGAWGGVVGVLLARSVVRGVAVVVAFQRWLLRRTEDAAEDMPDTDRAVDPVRSLLGFAGPTLLSAGIVLAGQTALRVLLVRRAGLDAAGFYQAGDSLAQGLLLVSGAASVALLPAVSRAMAGGGDGFPEMLRRAVEQTVNYSLVLCLAMVASSPWIVGLLFGPLMAPARPVLVLLTLAYGLVAPSALFGAALLGRGAVWTALTVNAVWVVAVLALFWFGAASFGAAGAAAAVAIAYALLLAIYVTLVVPAWGLSAGAILAGIGPATAALAVASVLAVHPGVPSPVASVVALALALWFLLRLRPMEHVRSLLARRRSGP